MSHDFSRPKGSNGAPDQSGTLDDGRYGKADRIRQFHQACLLLNAENSPRLTSAAAIPAPATGRGAARPHLLQKLLSAALASLLFAVLLALAFGLRAPLRQVPDYRVGARYQDAVASDCAFDPDTRRLLLGTRGGGTHLLDTRSHFFRQLTRRSTAGGLLADDVLQIDRDPDGRAYFLCQEGSSRGLCRADFRTNSWQTLLGLDRFDGLTSGHDAARVTAILPVDDDLWIGTDRAGVGVYHQPAHAWAANHRAGGQGPLPDDRIADMALGSDGSIWIATAKGIARLTGGKWQIFSHPQQLAGEKIRRLLIRGAELWYVTEQGGLGRFDGKNWDVLAAETSFGDHGHDELQLAARDAVQDALWFVAKDGEIGRYDRNRRSWRTFKDPRLGDNVLAIAARSVGKTSELLVGTNLEILSLDATSGVWSSLQSKGRDTLAIDASREVIAVLGGRSKETGSAVHAFSAGSWRQMVGTGEARAGAGGISAAASLPASRRLYVGTDQGISVYDGETHDWLAPAETSPAASVQRQPILDLACEGSTLLVLTAGRSVTRWDPGTGQESTIVGGGRFPARLSDVIAVTRDRTGRLWLATESELSVYDPNTHQWRRIAKPPAGIQQLAACRTSVWILAGGKLFCLGVDDSPREVAKCPSGLKRLFASNDSAGAVVADALGQVFHAVDETGCRLVVGKPAPGLNLDAVREVAVLGPKLLVGGANPHLYDDRSRNWQPLQIGQVDQLLTAVSRLWIRSRDGKLFSLAAGEELLREEAMPSGINAITGNDQRLIALSAEGGMHEFQGGSWTVIRRSGSGPEPSLLSDPTLAVRVLGDDLYATGGTGRPLWRFRFSLQQWQRLQDAQGADIGGVTDLAVDAQGVYALAPSTQAVYSIAGNAEKCTTESLKDVVHLRSLDGHVTACTAAGQLLLRENGRWVSPLAAPDSGLPAGSIPRIAASMREGLVVASERRAAILSPSLSSWTPVAGEVAIQDLICSPDQSELWGISPQGLYKLHRQAADWSWLSIPCRASVAGNSEGTSESAVISASIGCGPRGDQHWACLASGAIYQITGQSSRCFRPASRAPGARAELAGVVPDGQGGFFVAFADGALGRYSAATASWSVEASPPWTGRGIRQFHAIGPLDRPNSYWLLDSEGELRAKAGSEAPWKQVAAGIDRLAANEQSLFAAAKRGDLQRFNADGTSTMLCSASSLSDQPLGQLVAACELTGSEGQTLLVLSDGARVLAYDPNARRWTEQATAVNRLLAAQGALLQWSATGDLSSLRWTAGKFEADAQPWAAGVAHVAASPDQPLVAAVLQGGRTALIDRGGQQRILIGDRLPDAVRDCQIVAAEATDRDVYLALSDGGLYQYSINGRQWARLTVPDELQVASLRAIRGLPGGPWCVTDAGQVWQYDEAAKTWQRFSSAEAVDSASLISKRPVVQTRNGSLLLGSAKSGGPGVQFEKIADDASAVTYDAVEDRAVHVGKQGWKVWDLTGDHASVVGSGGTTSAWGQPAKINAACGIGKELYLASDAGDVAIYGLAGRAWQPLPKLDSPARSLFAAAGKLHAVRADGRLTVLNTQEWLPAAASSAREWQHGGRTFRIDAGGSIVRDQVSVESAATEPASAIALPASAPRRLHSTAGYLWIELQDGSLWGYREADHVFVPACKAAEPGVARVGMMDAGKTTCFVCLDQKKIGLLPAQGSEVRWIDVADTWVSAQVLESPEGPVLLAGDAAARLVDDKLQTATQAAETKDWLQAAVPLRAERHLVAGNWRLQTADGSNELRLYRNFEGDWREVPIDPALRRLGWDVVSSGLSWEGRQWLATRCGVAVYGDDVTGVPAAWFPLNSNSDQPAELTLWGVAKEYLLIADSRGARWRVGLGRSPQETRPEPVAPEESIWRLSVDNPAGVQVQLQVGAAAQPVSLDDRGTLGLDQSAAAAFLNDSLFLATHDGVAEFGRDLQLRAIHPVKDVVLIPDAARRQLFAVGFDFAGGVFRLEHTQIFDGKTWSPLPADQRSSLQNAMWFRRLDDRPDRSGSRGVQFDGKRYRLTPAADSVQLAPQDEPGELRVLRPAIGGFRHDIVDAIAVTKESVWTISANRLERFSLGATVNPGSFLVGGTGPGQFHRIGSRLLAAWGDQWFELSDQTSPQAAALAAPDRAAVEAVLAGRTWTVRGRGPQAQVSFQGADGRVRESVLSPTGFSFDAVRRMAAVPGQLVVATDADSFLIPLDTPTPPGRLDQWIPLRAAESGFTIAELREGIGAEVWARGSSDAEWAFLDPKQAVWQKRLPPEPTQLRFRELCRTEGAVWRRNGDDLELALSEPAGPWVARFDAVDRRFDCDRVHCVMQQGNLLWMLTAAGLRKQDAASGKWLGCSAGDEFRGAESGRFLARGNRWILEVRKGGTLQSYEFRAEAWAPIAAEPPPVLVAGDNFRAQQIGGKWTFELRTVSGGSEWMRVDLDARAALFPFQIASDGLATDKSLHTLTPLGVVTWRRTPAGAQYQGMRAGPAAIRAAHSHVHCVDGQGVENEYDEDKQVWGPAASADSSELILADSPKWRCRRAVNQPAVFEYSEGPSRWIPLPLHPRGGFTYQHPDHLEIDPTGVLVASCRELLVCYRSDPQRGWQPTRFMLPVDIAGSDVGEFGALIRRGDKLVVGAGGNSYVGTAAGSWSPIDEAGKLRLANQLWSGGGWEWRIENGQSRVTRQYDKQPAVPLQWDPAIGRFDVDSVLDAAIWGNSLWLATRDDLLQLDASDHGTRRVVGLSPSAARRFALDRGGSSVRLCVAQDINGSSGQQVSLVNQEIQLAPASTASFAFRAAYHDDEWTFLLGAQPHLKWRGIDSAIADGRFAHDAFDSLMTHGTEVYLAAPVAVQRYSHGAAGLALVDVLPLPPEANRVVFVGIQGDALRVVDDRKQGWQWSSADKTWHSEKGDWSLPLVDTNDWVWERVAPAEIRVQLKFSDVKSLSPVLDESGRFAFDRVSAVLADTGSIWMAGTNGVVQRRTDGSTIYWHRTGQTAQGPIPLRRIIRLGRFSDKRVLLPSSASEESLRGSSLFALDSEQHAWWHDGKSPGSWSLARANPWQSSHGDLIACTPSLDVLRDTGGGIRLAHPLLVAGGVAGEALVPAAMRNGRLSTDVIRDLVFLGDRGILATDGGLAGTDARCSFRGIWPALNRGNDLEVSAWKSLFVHGSDGKTYAVDQAGTVARFDRAAGAWSPVTVDNEFKRQAQPLHRDEFWSWWRWNNRIEMRLLKCDADGPEWPLFSDGRFSFDALRSFRIDGDDLWATTSAGIVRFRRSDMRVEFVHRTGRDESGRSVSLAGADVFSREQALACTSERGLYRYRDGAWSYSAAELRMAQTELTLSDGRAQWEIFLPTTQRRRLSAAYYQPGKEPRTFPELPFTDGDSIQRIVAADGRLWICLKQGLFQLDPSRL